jgi:hypothetical protein
MYWGVGANVRIERLTLTIKQCYNLCCFETKLLPLSLVLGECRCKQGYKVHTKFDESRTTHSRDRVVCVVRVNLPFSLFSFDGKIHISEHNARATEQIVVGEKFSS